MKKIRHKIILMLMLIMIVTYFLADLMVRPLVAEFFTGMETWVGEMMRSALEITLTFIIFTGFIIIGVREITTPLMRLSTATQRIADGDYTVDLAPSRRKDEMGELERNFAVMVGELKSTEHMQKDFISNVSHEFKTPLSVITGYAKLLAADALTAQERRKYSGFVIEEATRLDHMTRNILLLSKLENAKIQPPREEYALDEQLRQAALLYVQLCAEKQIQLCVEVPEIRFYGNQELLMHVFSNLLDNAVKFTPQEGTIRLSARVDAKGDGVTVWMEDSGIGMDEETRRRIWEQFYQGDRSRQSTGSGLGLTLAKRIVDVHGGALHVSSHPGAGSVFAVTLPVQTPPRARSAQHMTM